MFIALFFQLVCVFENSYKMMGKEETVFAKLKNKPGSI